MIESWWQNVIDFHRKFRPEQIGTTPAVPAPEVAALRLRLVEEEFGELVAAMRAGDLVETADAMADLVYVVVGAAVSYGIDLPAVFDAVHRSNMQKRKDLSRPDGKVTKPENWVPPDVAGILARQGPIGGGE